MRMLSLTSLQWSCPQTARVLTQAAAFLATIYGTYVAPSDKAKSHKYLCWARGQTRCGVSVKCRILSSTELIMPC